MKEAEAVFNDTRRKDGTRVASGIWDARDALILFDHSQSQWRVGMAGATGLDYVAVRLVARTLGISLTAPVLQYLQALEADQLSAWMKKAEDERNRDANSRGKQRPTGRPHGR